MRLIYALACLLCWNSLSAQKTYLSDWESLDSRAVPEWWQDAKFGIFVHWGVYSVPAFTTKGNYAEWYQYALEKNEHNGKIRQYHDLNFLGKSYYSLADEFYAELYNPDEWARLFEMAGAKYVVLTAKHHDGFCLWPNETANQTWGFPWNAQLRGSGRDLLGELFTALNKTKVKPGLYFSLYEWFNPLWEFDRPRFVREHTMPQLYEVVQKYQPWVVWSDGDWEASSDEWQSRQFLSWLYSESPVRDKVVANDRWGSDSRFKHGGFYTPEYQPDTDFENHAWEESRGMAASYGYNRHEDAWDYNSAQSLVLHLIDKVSRGGNFLLDVGPDGHGKIPPIMQERLLDIGKWLKINGEAIYDTRRWRMSTQWSAGKRDWKPKTDAEKEASDPMLKQTLDPDSGYAVKEVFYTWNPQKKAVYAIFPKYPDNRKLILKGIQLPATGTEVTFLATLEKLKAENIGGAVVITLPEYQPNKIKSDLAFAVKISGFGDFVAAPTLVVNYQKYTGAPTVVLHSTTEGAVIKYTTDGSSPSSSSLTYTVPFSPTAACTVRARAFKPGIMASTADSLNVQLLKIHPALNLLRPPSPGLRAEIRSVQDQPYTTQKVLRGFLEKADDVRMIMVDPLCKEQNCGMIWRGYLDIPETACYQFSLSSDDGSVLQLDEVEVVNNDGDHGMQEKVGVALLEKGWHTIRIVYYNSSGDADISVKYAPVGEKWQAIAGQMLGH